MREMFDKSQSLKLRFRAISLATLLSPFWFFSLIPLETAKAQQNRGNGCPAGTQVGGISNSLVTNGYFTQQPNGPAGPNTLFPGNWSSSVPYTGNNLYPPDTSVAIQTGAVNYAGGIVQQVPFPGDAANGVPASNNWLYSNGNTTEAPYTIWRQNIPTTSLQPNTTYVFYAYVSNTIATDRSAPDDPIIQFLVNGIPIGERFTVFDDSDPASGHNGQDLWDRTVIRFTTPATLPNPFTISIQDAALGDNGDDFGVVAVGVEACRPNIGIAKSVGVPVAGANGSFTIPYTMTVQNLAPVDPNVPYTVTNVQVTDNLATTFAGATINSVGNIQSSNPNLTVNPTFNGQGNQNLLQGTANDRLSGGETATITFNVNITPNGNFGPFNNTARVSAIYPASPPGTGPITDDSVNGTNTDPDGDLDANNNTSPTPVSLTPGRRIGVAKQAGTVVNNSDGTYTVPYTVIVRNFGGVALDNVQVSDDLFGNANSTFNGATAVAISSPVSVSGALTAANANFNGNSDRNLLPGTQTLPIGGSATINFSVRVTPGSNLGPFNNTARATATSPGNTTPVTDDSTDGVDPDLGGTVTANNNDGDPTNNNVPTTVSFNATPRIGVAKQAGTVVNNSDGTYTVPYSIIVRNYGNAALNNVQLSDDLFGNANSTFNGATAVAISSPVSVSGALTAANANFNGNSDRNLFPGTQTLPIGGSATINFSVRVTPGSNLGPFNNTARATATSPGSTTPVTDDSTDGVNPDLGGPVTANNSDGNPNNNNVPTPVSFSGTPNLRFVKRISNAFRNNAPLRIANFNSFIDDPNDSNDNAPGWSQLSPRGVISLDSQAGLQSGDEVEYTLYFLSDGTQSIQNARFCDLIPDDTAFVPNSFGVGSGVLLGLAGTNTSVTNVADTDRGSFFSALSPLPAGNSCINQTNRNGAVILNVGNLPQATGSNFGFVRFRVRLN
jgi:uncharacterized repeat protein (TIGR01451 family)